MIGILCAKRKIIHVQKTRKVSGSSLIYLYFETFRLLKSLIHLPIENVVEEVLQSPRCRNAIYEPSEQPTLLSPKPIETLENQFNFNKMQHDKVLEDTNVEDTGIFIIYK